MDIYNVLTALGCVFAILIIGKLFAFPFKKVIKFIINSITGALMLYLINLIGAKFGFSIGINIITSIIVGILGVPGVILLIVLKLLL